MFKFVKKKEKLNINETFAAEQRQKIYITNIPCKHFVVFKTFSNIPRLTNFF